MKEFDDYLLRLSDESFFALYRNYLGAETSPVRKHALIREFRAYFTRPTTIDRVLALIDLREREFLAAIELLPSPDEDALSRFFDGEPGPSAIRRMTSNLLDRLVLIRDAVGVPRINPLIADDVRSRVTAGVALVRFLPSASGANVAGPWMSLGLACGVRAFLSWNTQVFTRTGAIRRGTTGALDAAFPGLFPQGQGGEERFVRTIDTLSRLGLVVRGDDGTVIPVDETWEELGDLSPEWVNLLLWSAPLVESVEEAFEAGNTLRDLFAQWPRGTDLDSRDFLRAVTLIDAHTPVGPAAANLLSLFGVLYPEETRVALPDATRDMLAAAPGDKAVVLQANMEIVVVDAIPVSTAVALSEVCELASYDRAPRYVLTERSVMRAYQNRGSALPLLESIGPIPQNVRFNVSRWEERARAVRIRPAVVLQVSSDAARMVTASPALVELGAEKIADTVFLFPAGSEERLEAALNDMGVSALVEATGTAPEIEVPHYSRLIERYRQTYLFRSVPGFAGTEADPPTGATDPADRTEHSPEALHAALDAMDRDETARRELALRIDRKLVLFPDQLAHPVGGGALSEARGLDYLGKVRIIEQAIADGDLLEATFRAGSGSPERILCRPVELDRNGDDLMIRGRREPDGKAVRIRVRRMSIVRRLSGTLIREFRPRS